MLSTLKNIRIQQGILLLLILVMYGSSIQHEYTIDDRIVITANKLTQEGVSGIGEIFSHSYLYGYDGREDESYRPLTLTSFAIERSLFDASPKASHFIQIILYTLLILILLKWMQQLFPSDKNNLLGFVIVLLFTTHPIHSEVVANVKSRDEILAALFLILSFIQFGKYLNSQKTHQLIFSSIFLFLASLSKDSAIAGIGIYPLIALFFFSKSWGETIKLTWIYIIPVAFYMLIRNAVLTDVTISDPINPVANAIAAASNFSDIWALKFELFAKYIQLSIFPIHLSWDYSIPQFSPDGWNINSIIGLIAFLLIITGGIYGIFQRKIWAFGLLFFCITFALTSNFIILINCTIGERFLFLPILGIIISISTIVLPFIEKNKSLLLGLYSLIIILFVIKSYLRNLDWKDNLTIYTSDLATCPQSIKTNFNLATEYIVLGNLERTSEGRQVYLERAEVKMKKCIEIYPDYVLPYENLGYIYGELGKISLATDSNKAILHFKNGEAILKDAIYQKGFDKPGLYQNLVFAQNHIFSVSKDTLEHKRILNEIKRHYRLGPMKINDYKGLAYYYEVEGKIDSVYIVYQELIAKEPSEIGVMKEVARMYFEKGNRAKSLEIIEQYLAKEPNDIGAITNKAMLLEIDGKIEQAIILYEKVLQVNPESQPALNLYTNLKARTN